MSEEQIIRYNEVEDNTVILPGAFQDVESVPVTIDFDPDKVIGFARIESRSDGVWAHFDVPIAGLDAGRFNPGFIIDEAFESGNERVVTEARLMEVGLDLRPSSEPPWVTNRQA